ncbi:uncharacterized protein STEHIDRAFT_139371 [Stereum hirsutum FP-91666 SS1]|uniref:uncharacterized protein n=1 Tax=Stereum hirsutum (strain FP-91666) TaxID=721885 RepID=UPI00044104BD|nr:uncharacterized protein STEHIDRAFT_139371 [Stereum hirsutum FP-91666 SS1]EIM86501.1 hypothetical protein STEHIDRAFT_139371 [Stereum hirsutum FP-91666 SS1]
MAALEDAPYARIQVHEFVGENNSSETTATASPSRLQELEVLRKGRHYAQMACASPGWRTVSSSKFQSYSFTSTGEGVFAYLPLPPAVAPFNDEEHMHPGHILPWGTPIETVGSAGIFVSEGLEPFLTTKLDTERRQSRVSSKNLKARSRESSSSPQPVRKRPKAVISPLFTLISYPHYVPFPMVTPPAPPTPPPHARAFVSIRPHTTASIEETLSDEFVRLSWIIPIRGSIQPHDLTPASLLEEGLPADGTSAEIGWTRPSVANFWSFLKETIQQGAYGEVSLSFQPVATLQPPSRPVLSTTSESPSNPVSNSTTSTSTATLSSTVASPDPFHMSLRITDHIKIYCDALWVMAIRRAIEEWKFAWSEVQGEERDIQVLRDVKLVLVDGRNSPVLVS